jgi:hypothetical protein
LVKAITPTSSSGATKICCALHRSDQPDQHKIYQAIGYHPVFDTRLWRFTY